MFVKHFEGGKVVVGMVGIYWFCVWFDCGWRKDEVKKRAKM